MPDAYRKYLKDSCERCPRQDDLLVHHRDHDHGNDDPANLETLCRSCHATEHRLWTNLPDRPYARSVTEWADWESQHGEYARLED